jgi:hypothetical protein
MFELKDYDEAFVDHSKGMASANLKPRWLVDELSDMPISYH